MATTLDETDLQILKTLQKNAKLTTKELADAVHLTPTPVFEPLPQSSNDRKDWSARDTSKNTWLCSIPRNWDRGCRSSAR